MRLIKFFLLSCFLFICSTIILSLFNENQLKQELQQAQNNKTMTDQIMISQTRQSSVKNNKIKFSMDIINRYEKAIKAFSYLFLQPQNIKKNIQNRCVLLNKKIIINQINQKILKKNEKLMHLNTKVRQEQGKLYDNLDKSTIIEFQNQDNKYKILKKMNQKLQVTKELQILFNFPQNSPEQNQIKTLQDQKTIYCLKTKKFIFSNLNTNNHLKLLNVQFNYLTKQDNNVNYKSQYLYDKIHYLDQQKINQLIKNKKKPSEQSNFSNKLINRSLKINNELFSLLKKQTSHLDLIILQQHQAILQTLQICQILKTLKEQAPWLNELPILGKSLRNKISKLSKMNKPQPLDNNLARLRLQHLYFKELITQLPQFLSNLENSEFILNKSQKRVFYAQLIIQHKLLNDLLIGCDKQIIEINKLKAINIKLEKYIKEIQEAEHRYLFWLSDVNPINFSFFFQVVQDLHGLFNTTIYSQITNAFNMILTNEKVLIPLLGSLLLVGLNFSYRRYYYVFLERSSSRIGKVNQDSFYLTLNNVFLSIIVSLPLPILWGTLGYSFRHAWPYPIVVAMGYGINATVPILWMFILCAYFAHPLGLFVIHFNWPKQQVKRALRYYILSIGMMVPLIMILVSLNYYNDRKFVSTLGRLCFILLCFCLALVSNSLKRSGLLLYLNKYGTDNNVINHILWNLIVYAPIIAIISAFLGYLSTVESLLARLETSVIIWFFLLIIYYIIRRWMFIQRRRIAFDRAKQRRADILAQRSRSEEDLSQFQSYDVITEVDEKVLDLEVISAQSLQLVRSILTLIAFVSVMLLWSELHSAFGFLENITLWDVTTSIQGTKNVQTITLGEVLIAISVFIITTQMVRNLPSLLELAILQHLNLSPGTGYAITSLTKYILMILGCIIGFSIIGIEWSKLQWLIAALGVGLGFGLQEIFANFISGLMILFEKPIRIGDTVTIRHLTGNITRINTRATIITDWDKREIIVPNKAFITEQFINWSLSDTITRVVLNIPAPAKSNINQITNILLQAAHNCPLVLKLPTPEAFLMDLQHGFLLFELRMYAAEMGHRMPIRHQVHAFILQSYTEYGIELPFTLIQINNNKIKLDFTSNQ